MISQEQVCAITEECDVMSFGGSYAMGDFTLGATMYNVTNEAETVDYSVTDLSLGYNFSDNLHYRSYVKRTV